MFKNQKFLNNCEKFFRKIVIQFTKLLQRLTTILQFLSDHRVIQCSAYNCAVRC